MVAEELTQIGDLWLPTKIVQRATTSAGPPGEASRTTIITKFAVGKVRVSDLKLEIPPETDLPDHKN